MSKLRLRLPWIGVPIILLMAHPSLLSLEVGVVLAVTGLLIRGWAAGTIVKQRQLTTWGPYAYTRNPLYLGSLLLALGVSIATGSILVVAVVLAGFALLYARTIREEERGLVALYGEEYLRYREAVPAFLPRRTPYRHGAGPRFQVARYLAHREYQAALGLLALLAVLVADYIW